MNNLAMAYVAAGKLDLGLPLHAETLELQKAKRGPDHQDTLTSMSNLAAAYQAAGKLDLALPLFEETLKLQQAKLGRDHPHTLTSMNNLAGGYMAVGKLDKALSLYAETLQLQKAKLGPNHPDTLVSRNNLVVGYLEAGKHDDALPLMAETLKIQQATLGPDHPDTLRSMHNLAVAYNAAGQLARALPLYVETLKLQQAKLGARHPGTLSTMGNLAKVYRAAGQLDKGLSLLEEVLEIEKATLGPDHPATLTAMHNLANAYGAANRLAKAGPLIQETVRRRTAALGPDHPDTLRSVSGLASAHWAEKRLDKSIPLFEDVLRRFEAKLGRDHPDTQMAAANLGVNYKGAGRFKEAMPLLEEVLRAAKKYSQLGWVVDHLAEAYAGEGEIDKLINLHQQQLVEARQALPKDSPQLAVRLNRLGMVLLQLRRWAEAEPLLRESLAIRDQAQPDGWTTFTTRSLLGGALLGQQKHEGAESLLLQGYAGMKQREKSIPPESTVHFEETAEWLVRLYEATGQKDKAAHWQRVWTGHTGTPLPTVHAVEAELTLAGTLDAQTPRLLYQVQLAAGATYVIDLVSPNPKELDPYLVLRDAAGKRLAEDDDSGGNLNARLTFTAPTAGVYRLQVTSVNGAAGDFTLTIRSQPKRRQVTP
jgi:tetratricopeptide (TPR) repeat protein